MLFYPERLALAGLLVYGILWLLAPLSCVFPVSWEAMMYIFLCYCAFFCGCLMASGKQQRVTAVLPRPKRFRRRLFWCLAIAGAIGMALRFYDKWFLRGAGLASTILESREVLSNTSAGPISILGGVLYPFCYVPLIMWWFRPVGSWVHPWAKWASIVLFILPALDALSLLSRSQMLVTFSMMYFVSTCALYQGRAFPRQLRLPILMGLLGVSVISIIAFTLRLQQMDLDVIFSILNSTYGYVLTPNAFVLQLMNQADSSIGAIFRAVMPLLQYYLHGLFEFGLLWDRPDRQIFVLGSEQFSPYFKVLTIFGLSSAQVEPYYRAGVFTTFFGPLWVDFGWIGPLMMFGFGALCKYCAQRARQGKLSVIPLHAYFCVVLFFMPVVNFIVSAQGMYTINTFVVFWIIAKKSGDSVFFYQRV